MGQRIVLNSSTYWWDPTNGYNIDATVVQNGVTYLANWDLGSMGSHTHPTTLPTTLDTITFDGSSGYNGHGQYYNGNANCNVDTNLSGSVVLDHGYTSTITISDNIAFNLYGFTDNDIPADFYYVAFAGPNAVHNFAGGTAEPGNFAWEAGGKNTVNGADLLIGNKAGLSASTASPVIINSGTVGIGPYSANSGSSTFKLTNGSADINVNPNGQLDFYMPTTRATTLVDNTGTAAWISNNGSVILYNAPGGGTARLSVPLENHGTLQANQGGSWTFDVPDANNNDLYMDAGKISLAGGVTLDMSDNYKQDGGTLEIADNQREFFTASGTANFNGGKLVFDSPTGYGILDVANVTFNGVEIDMRINGTNKSSDLIECIAGITYNIQGNSKLVVTATNPVVKQSGITWTLITTNTKINGDFLAANITLPPNVSETAGALPNSWQCNS